MFKILKNLKGQGVTVQYAMTFVLVLAIVMGMTTYFKRVVQSRYAGVCDYAQQEIGAVFDDVSLNVAGNYVARYEPYYQDTRAIREKSGAVIDRTEGGMGHAGIQSKEYQGYQSTMQYHANYLAPKDAY